MKSKSVAFSCSGCWFADMAGQFDDNCIQIGCDAERESLFVDPVVGRTDFMKFPRHRSLDRFCNMYRGLNWAEDNGGQDNTNWYDDEFMVDLARQENMTKFGIAIFDDTSKGISLMESSLESAYQAAKNYGFDKVGVIMSYDYNTRNINETLHLVNKFTEMGLSCKGVDFIPREEIEDMKYIKEYDVFSQLVNADYFIRMGIGQAIGEKFLKQVDTSLNTELDKVLCYENKNVLAIQSSFMRQQYLNFKGYQDAERDIKYRCKLEGYYKKYE